MLGETGILTKEEMDQIKTGLEALKKKAESGEIEYSTSLEDIHLNLEKALIDSIGPVGGKLHTGTEP